MARGKIAVVLVVSGVAVAAGTLAVVTFLSARRKRLSRKPFACLAADAGLVVNSIQEILEIADSPERSSTVSAVDLTKARFAALPMHKLKCFSNLVQLDVGGCGLSCLPSDISCLQNLQALLAPRNKLDYVTPELARLSRTLVQLDLGTNHLSYVPPELCRLTRLETLNLMCNQLERLPTDFGRLRNLRLLGLKSNKLVELPASMSQLTNLVELFITDNRLTDLPAGMSRCTSLVKLQASFNAFTTLPTCLLRLSRLELLRVAVCSITALPPHLLEEGAMPRLAWFSVAGNPVCPDPPARAAELPVVYEDDLELGCRLGDGASGEVYRAVWQGQLVAVKFFRSDVSPDGRTEDEVALAMSLQHPHLTQVLAKVAHPPGLVLRLERGQPLARKPTSKHLLRCKWGDDVRFAPRRALLLAVAVADALSYCHAVGICHGDVYAHNVLMDEDENVTLCDFGASFSYDTKEQPYWQAMEVRAYGIMLQDVVQRYTLQEAAHAAAAAAGATPGGMVTGAAGAAGAGANADDGEGEGEQKPSVADRIFSTLREVAERCAELSPAKRPSFAAVCDELRALQREVSKAA